MGLRLKAEKILIMIIALAIVSVHFSPTLTYAADSEMYNGGMEIEDETDPTYAAGWSKGGTGITTPAGATGSIVRTHEKQSSGVYSIKISDTDTNKSYQAISPAVNVTTNTEYIGIAKVNVESISAANVVGLYFEFRNSAGSRVGTNRLTNVATTTVDFRPLSVISSTVATTVTNAALFANTTSGGTAVLFVDDFMILPLSDQLLLEHIDEKLIYSGTVDEIQYALRTAQGNFENVSDELKNEYTSRLKNLRMTKGSLLSKEQIQAVIDEENQIVTDAFDISVVKNELMSNLLPIILNNAGVVEFPVVDDLRGTTLGWTAIAGEDAPRFSLSDGTATLNSKPDNANGHAILTLTITKGGSSDTITYDVVITKGLDAASIAAINEAIVAGNALDTLNAIQNADVFVAIISDNASYYQSQLAEMRVLKDADLTAAEIQTAIHNANDNELNKDSIQEVKVLLSSGNLISSIC